MKLSIFTDASFITGSPAGYAFYIGCTKGMIKKAGIFKYPAKSPMVAELHCLANAIHTLKHCKFRPITSVFVYCDVIDVVNAINGERNNFKDKDLRDIVDEINFLMLEICIQAGVNIRNVRKFFTFTHVKAHTKQKDKFSLINNWCDREAVKYRKQASKNKKP